MALFQMAPRHSATRLFNEHENEIEYPSSSSIYIYHTITEYAAFSTPPLSFLQRVRFLRHVFAMLYTFSAVFSPLLCHAVIFRYALLLALPPFAMMLRRFRRH